MRLLFICLAFAFAASAVKACGPDTDCAIGARHYRIALPEIYDGNTAVPAIVFAHGFRGSARGVMRNSALRRLASELGVALIAVKSDGPGWSLPNGPRTFNSDGSKEFAYFDAVLDDATDRFAIDKDRILATGFSAGGMMVWNLACARSDRFVGFAPIAGTFWLTPPETCEQPVKSLIHIHGDADKTVPLLGRSIGQTKQGEVPQAIAMYKEYGGFGEPSLARYGDLSCKERQNNTGEILAFCLFSGGHSFRTEHLRYAWEAVQKAGRF
ncbi:MAG: PHB depolymerase family esterase [Roseobacter sp.]